MNTTTIECDFTSPEISLDGFAMRSQPDVSLRDAIDKDDCVQATRVIKNDPYFRSEISAQEIANIEVEALQNSINLVKDAIHYRGGVKPWLERPSGDCTTYTWVISEVADSLDLRSWIVFCNDHAFNLVQTSDTKLHIINGETRHMWLYNARNNPASKTMFSENTWQQITEDDAPEYSYHSLYGGDLSVYNEVEMAKQQRNIKLPWLEASHPAATVMSPEIGKRALFTHECLVRGLDTGNINEVGCALLALQGCNPQVETRTSINSSLKKFKSLVKYWSNDPEVNEEHVVETIRSYASIMPETKSMLILVGDCLRIIGETRQKQDLLLGAEVVYSEAEKRSKSLNDQTLLGKMNKTRSLIGQISE